MLKGEKKRLENHIVYFLGQYGKATAQAIYTGMPGHMGQYTIQGLYRTLRTLQADGIVVKEKKHYGLSLPWLMDMSALVETMQHTYLRHTYLDQLLPKGTQKQTWTFSNLLAMNDFWSHLLVAMARHVQDKTVMHYSPHTWYLVLHREHSMQFTRALLKEIKTSYTIVGSRSYLDKMATRITQDSFAHKQFYLAFPDEQLHKERNHHVDVVGDYVLDVFLDDETTEAIETLYSNTSLPEDIHSDNILPLYTNKAKIKMVLKKDPRRARIYKKKFETIFGPIQE